MSMADLLTQIVSSQLTKTASQKTGLSEGVAAKLMPVAMAAILGGLKKNASSPAGAEALANALRKHDGGFLSDVSRAGQDEVMSDGRKILGHVFGPKQSQMEAAIAKTGGGIDASQIAALLAMAAPAVLAALGKAQREQGLDARALPNLLQKETERATAGGINLGGLMSVLDTDGDGRISAAEMSRGKGLLSGLASMFGRKS
ncbi:MAG: DUF937 domain-containing protein [Parvularculaceae bacterium]